MIARTRDGAAGLLTSMTVRASSRIEVTYAMSSLTYTELAKARRVSPRWPSDVDERTTGCEGSLTSMIVRAPTVEVTKARPSCTAMAPGPDASPSNFDSLCGSAGLLTSMTVIVLSPDATTRARSPLTATSLAPPRPSKPDALLLCDSSSGRAGSLTSKIVSADSVFDVANSRSPAIATELKPPR